MSSNVVHSDVLTEAGLVGLNDAGLLPEGNFEKVESIERNDDSSTDISSGPSYEPIHASDRHVLTRIATSLSQKRYSQRSEGQSDDISRSNTLTGLSWDSPDLDPSNQGFDLYKWLRLFMHDLDDEGIKAKRAGIIWKDLSVSGSGAALQLQQNVGSLALEPFRMVKSLFSKRQDHKQILTKFNGSLRSGELLIVLGRPGSGCSTFLKSLCGEIHGLSLDKGSTVHYNGIPQKQMVKEFKGEVVYNQEVCIHDLPLVTMSLLIFLILGRQALSPLDCRTNFGVRGVCSHPSQTSQWYITP